MYFDYAATHPMRPVAIEAWTQAAAALNPNSVYASGRRARSILDDARETISRLLGCEPIEVIFTASGTEANNLAVQGLYQAAVRSGFPRRIVTTPIEHSAVLETARALEKHAGAELSWLPITASGHVDASLAVAELERPAAVAACMWANNETGALQPVAEMAAAASEAGTPFHVDAVQVVGKLPVDFAALGATTLAASAHKFGGPRGAGILLARRTPTPAPVLLGGGQERGIRPGTVDVAGAAATATALQEACSEMQEVEARVAGLRDELLRGILATIEDVRVNTSDPALPGHLNVSFPGTDGDSLLMLADAAGIEVSTGSACHAGVNRMSHVLEAMGVPADKGRGTLRFTLGGATTAEEIAAVLHELPRIVATARSV